MGPPLVVLRNARQPLAPDPGSEVSAISVQILCIRSASRVADGEAPVGVVVWGMRRKQDGWAETVARWEASDETAREFARRAGTSAATLYRWRRGLRRSKRSQGVERALARIVEVRGARAASDDRFEVRLADGRSVVIPPSFDGDALGRLLRVLEVAQ